MKNDFSSSSNTVIFVHGLGGWGPEEFLGFPYWAYTDLFRKKNFTTKVATLGKFTSNWDRACELYAQILGQITDYGSCHAAKYGHMRFGKDFTGSGLYPEWSEKHKVHLIGHSMGGQTMILLEKLLRDGSLCPGDDSSMFTGGKKWIESITAISGTLTGTSLVDVNGDDFIDFIRYFQVGLAELVDNSTIENLYDVDLEYWGINKIKGESLEEYWNRAQRSGVLSSDNKDFSIYDLSSEGALEINNLHRRLYPETYYFSYRTSRTYRTRKCFLGLFFCGDWFEEPYFLMSPFLKESSRVIGRESEDVDRKNDGLVPVHRQACPFEKENATYCVRIENGFDQFQRGIWYYQDFNRLDHLQVLLRKPGLDILNEPYILFSDLADRLQSISRQNQDFQEKSKVFDFKWFFLFVCVFLLMAMCSLRKRKSANQTLEEPLI
eukprot:snap_masked-scaffold_11-processed-gene-12.31-mRNA-1 protein AED:0.09 eAED:0.12 QI:0/-1/0/1/-1/1/1/0/435